MRKLYWFVLILVLIGVAYVVASKLSPAVDEWMLANVLRPIHGAGVSVYTTIITSPTWVTYIAPWGWVICGVGGLITGVLLYRWRVVDKIRAMKKQAVAVTLQREIPSSTPQPIPKQPVAEEKPAEKQIIAETA